MSKSNFNIEVAKIRSLMERMNLKMTPYESMLNERKLIQESNAPRILKSSQDFFKILSEQKSGRFVTFGYVSSAKLNLPKYQKINPKTKRKNSYDDYNALREPLNYNGEITGILKFSSYTVNWQIPSKAHEDYINFSKEIENINQSFGLPPTQKKQNDKRNYVKIQNYGDNGIALKKEPNEKGITHSYHRQNIYNARIKETYYLIGENGNIVREVNKEELKDFLQKEPVEKENILRKMGADEKTIQAYIDKILSLKFKYRTFVDKSFVYIITTIDGEKIAYMNDNLSEIIDNINIIPSEFMEIAKEKYQIDANNID